MDETPPQQALWKRLAPWGIAMLLLAWLFWRLDMRLLVAQLQGVNYIAYVAFMIVFCVMLLIADSVATSYVYRRLLAPITIRDFLKIRAASYLPAVINHHLGQAWITYFLARTYNARMWRAAGATALFYVTIFGCLVTLAIISVLLDPNALPWLPPVLAVVCGLGLIYFIIVWRAPESLARFSFVAPIFEMGVSGHLIAFAYRIPHVAIVFVGTWIPFLFFDVHIPPTSALALMPALLLISALPITPQGVGTRDAVAMHLFASFAVGTTAEQEAAVVAATLSWAILTSLIQITLSLLFIPRVRRLRRVQATRPTS